MRPLVHIEMLKFSGPGHEDVERLREAVVKEFNHIESSIPDVSGVFKSSDTPPKTIIVKGGIVTSIQ